MGEVLATNAIFMFEWSNNSIDPLFVQIKSRDV